MKTYLLTWNPKPENDGDSEEFTAKLKSQSTLIEWRWSCGNNQHIDVGSRVFLLRQGENIPGIVASGSIIA